ncbi:MAG TPA: carotenoid biosynthesis protein [Methanocella sp.]|nr:carotenoid biosynthesis protein [Methanocella sp.]
MFKNIVSGKDRFADILQWFIVLIALICGFVLPIFGITSAAVIALFLTFVFAIPHGIRRYGWKKLLLFFGISFIIGNIYENLSIKTGFPFGHYHYTVQPQLIHVPITIGLVYFGLGYISWLVASTLLDRADERLNLKERLGRFNVVALPLLAGAVMTMFDVGSDSVASTLNNTWIWHDGGGLFGVPYTNYLGWWLVTYTFFQVFALALAWAQTRAAKPIVAEQSLVQPTLIYLVLGLQSIGNFLYSSSGTVTDNAGVTWGVHALNESMMIINLFSLVIIGLLALAKIAQSNIEKARL